MHRTANRLGILDSYEVTGRPMFTSTRLAYVPWSQTAVQPYRATSLPLGPPQGLFKALQEARLTSTVQPALVGAAA